MGVLSEGATALLRRFVRHPRLLRWPPSEAEHVHQQQNLTPHATQATHGGDAEPGAVAVIPWCVVALCKVFYVVQGDFSYANSGHRRMPSADASLKKLDICMSLSPRSTLDM